jgi:hypothetical protein
LKRLFPHLTAMHYDMVLGIIRDIRQERVRASALLAFAEHAPGAVAVPSEYFGVASTFTRQRWWAGVHCAALPLLPDGPQRQALIDFLLTQLRRLTSEGIAEADLWNGLVPYLSGADLRTALDIAATERDTEARDGWMLLLAPCFDEAEAMTVVSAIQTPRWKAQALIALAERGDPVSKRPEFLATIRQLGADPELVPIAELLPDGQRLAVLDAAARELTDQKFTWDPSAPLASASPARLCAWWQQTALTLAGQGRNTVFWRIQDLGAFMYRVAGDHARLDLATAILDVVRWWP